MNRINSLAVALIAVALSGPALATTSPVQADTFFSSAAKNTNYGDNVGLKVSATQSALVQFDLSTLPAGTEAADVEKASVLLWVNAVSMPGSMRVLAVTSAWSENSVTYNTRPTTAAVLATVTLPATEHYVVVDVTAQVKSWLANPGSNRGIEFVAVGTTSFQLDSKENAGVSPTLDVTLLLDGAPGAQGPKGDTGIAGPAGPAGVAGAAGPAGPVGPTGQIGATGATGIAGPVGATGATGAPGAMGPVGAPGAAGPAGPQGAAGVHGETGQTGPRGPKGDTGETGPQGPAGAGGGPRLMDAQDQQVGTFDPATYTTLIYMGDYWFRLTVGRDGIYLPGAPRSTDLYETTDCTGPYLIRVQPVDLFPNLVGYVDGNLALAPMSGPMRTPRSVSDLRNGCAQVAYPPAAYATEYVLVPFEPTMFLPPFRLVQ
jgi:hypothetical protein